MSEEKPYEVVVAGAGPVGLSAALFLAERGVRVLVVDKRDPLTGPPRAGASVRTLELFRSIGLGARVDELAWNGPAPLRSVVKDSAAGAVRHRAGPPARYAERLETCSPIDIRRTLTQYEVQLLALDRLRQLDADVRFGAEVVDVSSDADAVRARVVESGRTREVTGHYLVGADGARSRVRAACGIDVPDRRVAARLNTAFFRADLGRLLPESATHACFVRNEHVHCTLFAKSAAGDHWSSHLMDQPGELTPEQTLHLLRAAIGDDTVPIELISCNAWEAAIGIASAFRHGRVFLAGDAAHVQSSAGGLGMNTGIQDGHNLAWKLAAVLNGHADEALLDSYEPERRAAAEASLALSFRLHRGYQDGQDTNELYARLAADYLRGMMFHHYESGAVVTDDAGAPDVLDDRAVPGRRLPHRWLDGGTRSTLDLVGSGWALLTGEGWQATPIDGVRVVAVPGAVFPDLADGALLVRPDGFVAWRAAGLPVDPAATVRGVLRTLHWRPARGGAVRTGGLPAPG
ncbi:FAD-dependent oxidoreductase [Amycolatopsis albispora]|uniref:FAD-binding monooxygenase n=1 Tax=Amycolatopsis albispora TaxID=1804986 RepID=A0A344KZN7_9PSEU|nr:FAD-dependent oxidoreductase [Amycolatopsis albispora]AXB41261.1 FAD-binding monooxygenase [Amycolatopsis albispora]